MSINKENYEAYFLDYAEGNLDPLQEQELTAFLDENPELRLELESFSNFTLPVDDTIVFDDKERLKRSAAIVSFSRKNYYYAAAAMIAIILTIGGISRWQMSDTNILTAPTVTTAHKTEAIKVASGIKNIQIKTTEKAASENINISEIETTSSTAIANNNIEEKQKISGENQNIQFEEPIRSLESKEVYAIENNTIRMEQMEWQKQLMDAEYLWADNSTSRNYSTIRNIISSGAELGIVPETISEKYGSNDNKGFKLSNISVTFPIPDNKIFDLIKKD